MANFKKLLWTLAAIPLLTACSNDDFLREGESTTGYPEGEGVYMALTVEMPSINNTRSATTTDGQSNSGTEVGTDAENNVGSVLIVIAKSTDNSYIVSGEVLTGPGKLVPQPASNSYKTLVKMQKTNLNDYYAKPDFSNEVNIFAFCNPTVDLKDAIKACTLGNKEWLNTMCSVIQGGTAAAVNNGIWSDNSFLMNNVAIATRLLPATINDWDSYKTEATAFDFSGVNQAGQDTEVDNSATSTSITGGGGAVRVERSVARLDFRDGSKDAPDPATVANTYNVVKNKAGHTIIQVELTHIMLANMSNKFYYLPRTSADGLLLNSAICGSETNTNYVVGPYCDIFNTTNPVSSSFSTYFNYPFFNTNGSDYNKYGWDKYLISDVLDEGKTTDFYPTGTGTDGKPIPGNYKVWRYVTENVIPAQPVNQRNGVSTGIVFKGRMLATEECNLEATDENYDKYLKEMYDYINGTNGKTLTGNPYTDPILYSFNGSLYFTWENVVEQAIANSVTFTPDADAPNGIKITNVNRSEPLYIAVFGTGGMGTFIFDGVTYTDPDATAYPVDANSTNELYKAWKPTPTNTTTFDKMRDAMVTTGFTLYQTSKETGEDPGYYCYYFYWNRHNDNGQNGVMGPMEFATVRNNVYKLAVTNIKQLGHPRIPANDPDSPDPGTPDESDDIYMTVTCQVVPWVVRINNIEF